MNFKRSSHFDLLYLFYVEVFMSLHLGSFLPQNMAKIFQYLCPRHIFPGDFFEIPVIDSISRMGVVVGPDIKTFKHDLLKLCIQYTTILTSQKIIICYRSSNIEHMYMKSLNICTTFLTNFRINMKI